MGFRNGLGTLHSKFGSEPDRGRIPLDPESLSHEVLLELGTEKRYRNRRYMDLLEDTKKVADVNVEDYDAIYLTGGHV